MSLSRSETAYQFFDQDLKQHISFLTPLIFSWTQSYRWVFRFCLYNTVCWCSWVHI